MATDTRSSRYTCYANKRSLKCCTVGCCWCIAYGTIASVKLSYINQSFKPSITQCQLPNSYINACDPFIDESPEDGWKERQEAHDAETH